MDLEVLSPAGNRECLEAVLRYGADAVYLAGSAFGMRTAPDNFTADGIAEAVKLCHGQKKPVRVYAAVNTLPRSVEIAELPRFLSVLDAAGVDAVIAADLGVMALARRYCPRAALHISTQFGVVNYETANRLFEMGASRIVLARELSIEEIAEIRAKTDPALQLECFVHGAMCISWSGRCVISNWLTGRDANRGDCAQPCRWPYRAELIEPARDRQPMTLEEDRNGSFLFNANDLNMIGHLPALAAAGVTAFKIEGRAKAAYYAAAVTNAYQAAKTAFVNGGRRPDFRQEDWVIEELNRVSHRPYGTGFYFGQPAQETVRGGYIRDWQVAAVVTGYENGRIVLSQRNRFSTGETLSVLEPQKPPYDLTVTALYDQTDAWIPAAPHPQMICRIPWGRRIAAGSFLRKKI
ncbi:MAG: U32 family peptidase [Oscillospiraceae bacterium]|nr:U32 family peptidase [Oscillospiraceae bacterium]